MSNIHNNIDEDRLAQINNELRNKKVKVDGDDTPWLPLESNPEIFTKFGHDVSNWYRRILLCSMLRVHIVLLLLIYLYNCILLYCSYILCVQTYNKDWYAKKL